MTNILTPEVITALIGFVFTILVGYVPQFTEQLDSIRIAITAIIIGLMASQIVKQNSIRQEQTKIEIARMQINEIRTYNAIREQINATPKL